MIKRLLFIFFWVVVIVAVLVLAAFGTGFFNYFFEFV